MPTGTASRSAPPPAPGRTPPEPLPPVQTKGQSSSARRAVCPGLFLLPRLPACPACRISSPARAGRCAAPGKSWKVPGERWAQYPDITPTACTGKDQHRQRRTDDPAAHQLHRLPIACTPAPPDLTAADQQPAPTACTHQQQRTPQPCRLPAAADQHHPRPPNGPKPAHRGPLPEGSDSLPTRHIDYAV